MPIHYVAPVLSHPADEVVSRLPLGALYQPTHTVFRLWAPTASAVLLHLYQRPVGGQAYSVALKPSPLVPAGDTIDEQASAGWDGSWEVMLSGDWLGAYYTYTVAGNDPRFDPRRPLLDPYAKCVTAHNGRAIVLADAAQDGDSLSATQANTAAAQFTLADAIIYELHLRDFTLDPDSGMQRRGKYLGLTERGTHLTHRNDISTGLDHLIELGVNVVQLLPVSTFHTDAPNDLYGWGYDVVHHLSPEGWYATERGDACRVQELKRLIRTLHGAGMRVTLDVVFNHTFEAIDKQLVFSFEGIVPGYFYRLRTDGTYWDGSGTGNEFRTEAPMARRYLLDCLKYWVKEFSVDGFRFDLLGLIDEATMRLIVAELHALDPSLLLYGEPWAGGTTPIPVTNKGTQRGAGWAVFNDHFRDALKGNVFDARESGFLQAGTYLNSVKRGLRGAIDDFTAAPVESINYVECHDNHTLWDRLLISTANDARITETARRGMSKLAALMLMTAQGVPFLHAGQEFLRSKGGEHNSYNQPDSVNLIRWGMKAEHFDIYAYYRGMVAIRRAHPLFRLKTAEEVRRAVKFLDDDGQFPVPLQCIAMLVEDVTGQDTWEYALVLLNPTRQPVQFTLPKGPWLVFANSQQASPYAQAVLGSATQVCVSPHSGWLLARLRVSAPLTTPVSEASLETPDTKTIDTLAERIVGNHKDAN